ncbi:MAG: hypothetical protein ACREOM_07230 [Candidatus Dormibacteraceae bacterium]
MTEEINYQLTAGRAPDLHGHPISSSTLSGIPRRTLHSCHHMLRIAIWLGRSPESFLTGHLGALDKHPLPSYPRGRVPRWNLPALHAALDRRRLEEYLSWSELAGKLALGSTQLTGLPKATNGAAIEVVMKIVTYLDRPSADFIYLADR